MILEAWKNPYQQSPADDQQFAFSPGGLEVHSIDLVGVTARELVLTLSEITDQPFACSADVADKEVTLKFTGSVNEILDLAARQLDTSVVTSGRVTFLGEPKPSDLTVYVRRVRRLEGPAVSQLAEMVGAKGRTLFTDDGMCIVVDEAKNIRRIDEVLRLSDNAPLVTWVIQFWLVNDDKSRIRDFGIEATPSVNLSAALAGASGGLTAGLTGAAAASRLDLAAKAISSGQWGRVLTSPLVLVRDGQTAKLTQGSKIPVKLSTVQTQPGATSTLAGIQYVSSGLNLSVGCRESSLKTARLQVNCSLNSVSGANDGIPITVGNSLDTTVDVTTGGVYLVGELENESDKRAWSRWLRLGESIAQTDSKVQVYLRAFRIAERRDGGAGQGGPAGEEQSGANPCLENPERCHP